jgi:CheY-like chemotaxis protein
VNKAQPVEILQIEDNPGDVRLTEEALRDVRVLKCISVVEDGVEALAFLHREGRYATAPRPDLILLDLNLPRNTLLSSSRILTFARSCSPSSPFC